MIRVALFTHAWNRQGGIERVVAALADHLPSMGYRVTLVAARFDEPVPAGTNAVKVVCPWSPWLVRQFTYWWMAGRWARRHRGEYDFFHAHVPVGSTMDAWTAHSLHRAALAATGRGLMPGAGRIGGAVGSGSAAAIWLSEANLRDPSTRVVAVSEGTARDLRALGVDADRIIIIPNGVDLRRFNGGLRERWREEVVRELGLLPGNFILLFVGKEFGRKGLRHAIEALPLCDPAVSLVVLGRNYGNPPAEYYEELAGRLGVGPRLRFLGHVSDVERYLGAADLFVFPTLYESAPLVALEAQAAGVPLLATRVNGIEDFLRDGVNGAWIEPAAKSIAGAVNRLHSDPAGLDKMRREAVATAEKYGWEKIVRMYAEMYESRGAAR